MGIIPSKSVKTTDLASHAMCPPEVDSRLAKDRYTIIRSNDQVVTFSKVDRGGLPRLRPPLPPEKHALSNPTPVGGSGSADKPCIVHLQGLVPVILTAFIMVGGAGRLCRPTPSRLAGGHLPYYNTARYKTHIC